MALPVKDREYVETATKRFRAELRELVAQDERAGVDVRQLLDDPVDFAARAVQAPTRTAGAWTPRPWKAQASASSIHPTRAC
jgi:hypothetical protein